MCQFLTAIQFTSVTTYEMHYSFLSETLVNLLTHGPTTPIENLPISLKTLLKHRANFLLRNWKIARLNIDEKLLVGANTLKKFFFFFERTWLSAFVTYSPPAHAHVNGNAWTLRNSTNVCKVKHFDRYAGRLRKCERTGRERENGFVCFYKLGVLCFLFSARARATLLSHASRYLIRAYRFIFVWGRAFFACNRDLSLSLSLSPFFSRVRGPLLYSRRGTRARVCECEHVYCYIESLQRNS